MITKDFVLAGKAVFTIEPPAEFASANTTPSHWTFMVKRSKPNANWGESWFARLLTGPNNTSDYTYLGKVVRNTGEVRLTPAGANDCKKYSPKTDNPYPPNSEAYKFWLLGWVASSTSARPHERIDP